MAEVRVRFAPSPTGLLHIGGARTALFNYLFAKRHGGKLILRIDDTDRERSRQEFEADILSGLEWLGIAADQGPHRPGEIGRYRQSERLNFHLETIRLLVEAGVAKDVDGTTRLSYGAKAIEFRDEICGDCKFLPKSLGPDPVLLRADGVPTYHLASVSDDIEMGITHIIRGQDHLTNTAKHVRIYQALGKPLPVFAHLPLLLGSDGSKLSKRDSEGLTALTEFRRAGYLREALINFLVLLGWSHPEGKEQLTLEEAGAAFSLERVSHTAAVFDRAHLDHLNGWWIRHGEIDQISARLLDYCGEYRPAAESVGIKRWQEIVSELRDGLASLTDAAELTELLFAEEIPVPEAWLNEARTAGGLDRALEVAGAWRKLIDEVPTADGEECYGSNEVTQLMSQLKKRCPGVTGKELFQPLRMAVMSRASGPELKVILRFITRQNLISRVEYVIQVLGG